MRNSYAYRASRVVAIAMVTVVGVALFQNDSDREALAQSAALENQGDVKQPGDNSTDKHSANKRPAGASMDAMQVIDDAPGLTRVSLAAPFFGPNVLGEIAPSKSNPPRDRDAISEIAVAQPLDEPRSAANSTRAVDCCVVGDFEDAFGSSRFFVGNVFSTTNGATLTEVKFELDFTSAQTEAITYVVYRFDRVSSMYFPELIKKVNHFGQGQRFYSSGAIELMLTPDTDMMGEIIPSFYFVGAGWDVQNVSFITWGRDDDSGGYPTTGCLNTIEGSFGSNSGPPPVGSLDPLSIPVLFQNGVASMQLCTQAPGGACCRPDGSCVNDVTSDDCTDTLGGSFFGNFTLCELENCEGVGACCLGVSCQNLTEADCMTMGGTYKGDGNDCSFVPDPCDASSDGACCRYDGGCEEVSQYDCVFDPRLDTPGIFSAPGVECTEADCQPLGACCDGFDNCNDTDFDGCDEFNCAATVGTTGLCGPGFVMDTNNQCLPPTPCIQSTGLEWNEGEPCDLNACFTQFSVGACCLLGECTVDTQLTCENQGGVFTAQGVDGWQACSTNGFPGLCATSNGFDRGACCLPTGCEIRDQASCTGSGGTFQGSGVECTAFICSEGACCWDNMGSNACADVLPLECTGPAGLPMGVYQGPSTSCPFDACEGEKGACCNVDGTCVDVPRGSCDETNGFNTFNGEGTRCATTSCIATGACCEDLGPPLGIRCRQRTATECSNSMGEFAGVGTVCLQGSLTSCDIGACCQLDLDTTGAALCDTTTRVECSFTDDALFDDSVSTCGMANCPVRGACCTPTGCEILTSNGCVTSNGVYRGDGVSCETDTCTQTACCLNAGGCVDTFLDQCVNGTPGNPGQLCSSGNLCADGGCCADIGAGIECFDGVSQVECQVLSGQFGGAGSDCTGMPCALGACCLLDGSCLEQVTQLSCTGAGGAFTSAVTCLQVTCVDQCSSFPGNRLGDFDGDGDVDLVDFGEFQLCFGNAPSSECQCIFDANLDGVISETDYSAFEANVTGALPPTGRCCHLDGTCDAGVRQTDCSVFGGATFDAGGVCSPNTCVDVCAAFPGVAPGDIDGDSDVDMHDFEGYLQCFGTNPTDQCMCVYDANEDGVVDSDVDYSAFNASVTGPN